MDVKEPNDSVELLKASQHFFLNNLKKLCEVYIRNSLELDALSDAEMAEQAVNAFQGFEVRVFIHYLVARYHDANRLKEFAIKFIVEYYDKFSKTDSWSALDEDSLSEINIWRAGNK